MILSRAQVNTWAGACLALSDEIADADGFVPVRSLLSRFDAELVQRPLLVEAMLCESVDAKDPNVGAARWRLLVDSEKFAFPSEALAAETTATPLPSRFRNTIAHELTHSLAFRAKEFGVDLTISTEHTGKKAAQVVEEIEQHTEDLSPLLLAPDRAIDRLFPSTLQHLSVDDLVAACSTLGVSRFVLIQRLNLMRAYGSGRILERSCFLNTAIGIGSWAQGSAILRGSPLFAQFEANEPPAFVHALRRSNSLDISSSISDPSFVLNGGDTRSLTLEVPCGTEKNPHRSTMRIQFSAENTNRRAGSSFLFVARRLA